MLTNRNAISRPALALVLVAALCGFIQDEWMLFSPDKKFSIELPGEPMLTPQQPGVKKILEQKVWIFKSGDQAYLIQYFGIPDDVNSSGKDVHDILFSKVREGFLQANGVETKITSEKSLTVEKLPARDYEATGVREEDGMLAFIKGRAVIARDRLYIVCAMGVGNSFDSSSADRFFNSFKILKP